MNSSYLPEDQRSRILKKKAKSNLRPKKLAALGKLSPKR